MLVAFSEEAIFRALFAWVWSKKGWGVPSLYAASTLVFALLHAPQGLVSVLDAALFGVMAMWLYRRSGSLWPPIVVHYLVDLVAFSKLGCFLGVASCLGY